MNNEAQATKKAKSTKPASNKAAKAAGNGKGKGAAAKAAGNGKAAEAASPAAGKVFRVDAAGGPLRQVKREDAIKDAYGDGSAFTREILEDMLDRNEIIFSADETFYYSRSEKALSKYIKENPPEAANPQPQEKKGEPVQGDIVYSEQRQLFGEVLDADGVLRVRFEEKGVKKSVKLTDKWRHATDEEAEAFRNPQTALEKSGAPIEAEVVLPLSDEERAEFEQRKQIIREAKAQFENAPMVMGEQIAIIQEKRLYRDERDEEGKPLTFGAFMFREFGITREYAHNLAQISGYHRIALEAVAESEQLQLSVNATNQMVRATNRFAREMGLDTTEGYEALKPLIANTARLIADVAPRDRDGKATITPRLVSIVNEQIEAIIKDDVVHIDGKAMKVSEAKEKGVLAAGFRNEVLEATAESIQRNRQTIIEEARGVLERAKEPVTHTGRPKGATVFYSGTVPELAVSCDKHGSVNNKIVSIGNGTFQTKCECRWRIDANSGQLVCFEVKGKPVKTVEAGK